MEASKAAPSAYALFEQVHKRLFSDMLSEHYINVFKTQCCLHHAEMHSQFMTLESELLSLAKNHEIRLRVKQRYGGFMLATLVAHLESPLSTSEELLAQIQCA